MIWYAFITAVVAAVLAATLCRFRLSGAVITGVLQGVFSLWLVWWQLPALSLGYSGLLWLTVVAFLPLAILALIRQRMEVEEKKTQKTEWNNAYTVSVTTRPYKASTFVAVGWGVLVLGTFVFSFVTSGEMLHASNYASLLPKPEERKLEADITGVDGPMRLVAPANAAVNVNRIMGGDPGLGSRVEVAQPYTSMLNGCFKAQLLGGEVRQLCFDHELVEVAPLEHRSLLTWFNNRVTPGYILASAVDPNKYYVITGLVGDDGSVTPLKLRYLPSAYWGDDLQRHVYTSGFAQVGLSGFVMELNDAGRPYFVASTYANRVGWDGAQVTGVVVADPQSGEVTAYTPDKLPAWLERAYPQDIVTAQLDWYGQYQGGWLNATFGAKQDVQKTTGDYEVVEGADGQLYYYTGFTSVGNDQSTSGYVMVSMRTGQVRWYRFSGATERAAMHSAEQAIRPQPYNATFAIMYNVGGVPSYFMPMLDSGGLPKAYAFVDAASHNVVGTGLNWQEALVSYRRNLTASGQKVDIGRTANLLGFTAVVADITSERRDEGLVYYLLLAGHEGKEYSAPVELSPKLKWTHTGDSVTVSVEDTGKNPAEIVTFDNPKVPVN